VVHISPITCVDHDRGNDRLVTGGYDGRVVCRENGRQRWMVTFDDLVNDVRFSPDGSRVAVAVADRHAFVLDASDGSHRLVLGPHGDDVNVVRWLPDGSGLVCVMDHLDPVVRIWHEQDGSWVARELIGHSSGVFGAALDPTGQRLATAAEDRTARLWDLGTLTVQAVLAHPGDPEAIDWSPDGSLVATGCDDGICRLWDPETATVTHTLTEAEAAVRFVRFSPDGRRLLVGAYDATMRDYDTATWAVVGVYRAPLQWERAAVHRGADVVVGSFGAEPIVHTEHPTGGHAATAAPLQGPSDLPHRAALHPTYGINCVATRGGRAVVGRDDGSVVALDVSAGAGLRELALLARHDSIVNSVAFSPDGTRVASADYRGVIHVTDHAGEAVHTLRAEAGGPINAVVWAPDGSALYSAGYDGRIRRWSAEGEPAGSWAAHHGPIKSLAWSVPTGLLVAGSSDGTLSAWADGEVAWRAAHDELVLVNAVAADAVGLVVSASRDLYVRRWDAATGALVDTLPRAHTKSVKAVATSGDGRILLSGAYDGTAVLWHLGEQGWRWRRLLHHGKPGVPAVALGVDRAGRPMALTAGWNGSVGRWALEGELSGACTPAPL